MQRQNLTCRSICSEKLAFAANSGTAVLQWASHSLAHRRTGQQIVQPDQSLCIILSFPLLLHTEKKF